jgi:hypothetical protein
MHTTRFERFLPLSGILAAVFFAGSDWTIFSIPSIEGVGKQQAYVDWAVAHSDRFTLAGISAALAGFFMLFFVGAVRASLRSRESGESTYSSVAFGAGIAYAGTLLIQALISLSMAQAGSAHDRAGVQAIGWLQDVNWAPWAAASGALLLTFGLGGLRTAALPKVLAWVLVVLGVLSITGPTGELVFVVTPLWMIATAIVLSRRASADARVVPAPRVPAPSAG